MTNVLDATDLWVQLGGESVLGGVSLSVERGEFVGLVGPNGAGKTTLLHTLNGTRPPDDGTVRVDGEPVGAQSSREVARQIATVPQETTLSFSFSVADVVEMGRTPYVSRFGTTTPADHEAVKRAMAAAEVAEFADRSVQSLSGGERQRVLLARALAQETETLLLDEPTASLDINHQVRTLELVADAVADGRAVVAAIHDLDLAARYCDRLLLLADGGIRAAGEPASVLASDALQTAFGVPTELSEDPTTGTPRVTAVTDRESTPSEDGPAPDAE